MFCLSILRHYGLVKPYNMAVALPFVLSVFGFLIVLIVGVILWASGELTIGTQRSYFICYVLSLLLLAVLISRVAIASYVLLAWCSAEVALPAFNLAFLPEDIFTMPSWFSEGFKYHPLIHIVPKSDVRGEWRIEPRNISVYRNFPINWSAVSGQEFHYVHNSIGARGREITKEDLSKDLIFVYGGSTTYDIAVTQGKTWVERLESDLNHKYTFVNLGVPSHNTSEHLIYTAFYQSVVGKTPVCAIYYVGWNDLRNAHIENLDAGYANFTALSNASRRQDLLLSSYSPLMRLLNRALKKRFDSIPTVPDLSDSEPVSGVDLRLEKIYVGNLETIAAINKSRSVETVFIGNLLYQPFYEQLPNEPSFHAPLLTNRQTWPLHERFNDLLRQVSKATNVKYIEVDEQKFQMNDFIDQGHFSAEGAEKFARLIAADVDRSCDR